MRKICLTLAALLATFAIHAQQPAQAETVYPWCAETDGGGIACSFVSLEQCLASISAAGDSCGPNPAVPLAGTVGMGSPGKMPPQSRKRPRNG